VRLFSNILAGHTLLAILSGFLAAGFSAGLLPAVLSLAGFALFIALVALELAVSFIQAFVFTVLVANYVEAAPTVCP
jgi:F-type H+-transporting ATPase subunit a